MSEEETVEADEGKKKKKGKKTDYCEVEFEIGNIEFEAKGRSIELNECSECFSKKSKKESL